MTNRVMYPGYDVKADDEGKLRFGDLAWQGGGWYVHYVDQQPDPRIIVISQVDRYTEWTVLCRVVTNDGDQRRTAWLHIVTLGGDTRREAAITTAKGITLYAAALGSNQEANAVTIEYAAKKAREDALSQVIAAVQRLQHD